MAASSLNPQLVTVLSGVLSSAGRSDTIAAPLASSGPRVEDSVESG